MVSRDAPADRFRTISGLKSNPVEQPGVANRRGPVASSSSFSRLAVAAHRAFDLATPGRIKSLEGARGLSVLLVFLVHYDALFGNLAPHKSITASVSRFAGAMGNAGVDMFFVISGYLIYGAVIRKQISVERFLRRRIQRIYPTFLCVLALYLFWIWLDPTATRLHSDHVHSLGYLLENVLLLPGLLPITPVISVAWSLSFEMFFYIALPILVTLLAIRGWSRRARVTFFGVLALADLALSMLGLVGHVRLTMFIPGVILYECVESRLLDQWLSARNEKLMLLLSVLGMLTVGWLGVASVHEQSVRVMDCIPALRVVILSAIFSSVLIYSFRFDGILRAFLSWTPICWLGNISYSYYLVHGGALHGLRAVLIPQLYSHVPSALYFWSMLPVGVAFTIATSIPIYLIVEKPFSLGSRRQA
jgi:peptidoglycan/LPS O-acetylase OafA/YrhL